MPFAIRRTRKYDSWLGISGASQPAGFERFAGGEEAVKRIVRILIGVVLALSFALVLWFATRPSEVQKDPAMQEIIRPLGDNKEGA